MSAVASVDRLVSASGVPVGMSQIRTSRSAPAVARRSPSGLKARALTLPPTGSGGVRARPELALKTRAVPTAVPRARRFPSVLKSMLVRSPRAIVMRGVTKEQLVRS